MLLPLILSEVTVKLGRRVTIGFILYTPFPSGDVFKTIPVWDNILEGVLRCKIIGLHTSTYAQNFGRACSDYL